MKGDIIDNCKLLLHISYDELYNLLQCVAYSSDDLDEEDIPTVIGIDLKGLEVLRDQLHEFKEAMRIGPARE